MALLSVSFSCVTVFTRRPGALIGRAEPSSFVKVMDPVGIAKTAVVLKATPVALDTRLPASSSATTQTVYAVDWFRLGVGETTTDRAMFARTAMLVPFAAEPDTVPALIVEADGTPAAVWFAAVGSTT